MRSERSVDAQALAERRVDAPDDDDEEEVVAEVEEDVGREVHVAGGRKVNGVALFERGADDGECPRELEEEERDGEERSQQRCGALVEAAAPYARHDDADDHGEEEEDDVACEVGDVSMTAEVRTGPGTVTAPSTASATSFGRHFE